MQKLKEPKVIGDAFVYNLKQYPLYDPRDLQYKTTLSPTSRIIYSAEACSIEFSSDLLLTNLGVWNIEDMGAINVLKDSMITIHANLYVSQKGTAPAKASLQVSFSRNVTEMKYGVLPINEVITSEMLYVVGAFDGGNIFVTQSGLEYRVLDEDDWLTNQFATLGDK